MKRFQFRLESLLRYREHLLEQAQQEVARIRGDVLACDERIVLLEKDSTATHQELETEVSTGIDTKRYQHFTKYLEGIESHQGVENLRRKQLMKLLEEKQKHLHQRAVDKKVLENLKNRRRDDYYKDLIQTLHKETDDTVIVRQARSMVQ
jgi:flagellar protein FliJ